MRLIFNNYKRLATVCAILFISGMSLAQNKEYKWKEATSKGYTYRYVTNDPMNTRFYTLDNDLQVALSENHREPRIAVNIAVRAGSNTDPEDHTGLAHYLEHILFKGTDQFSSLDWKKEKSLLDKIEILYEKYNSTTDEAQRKEIYKEIDKVSHEASQYAIAGEYDKLMTDIGSQGTNAHTWVEETVYKENIPSNTLDKFLTIQAERFRNPVVRLFHTELEAVYEEKNRSLDNDGQKMNEVMNDALFPTHNYGQQTTIGTIEHLKNPSITAIKEYYNKYYVPNNMAVIMVGDFDTDELIAKIDKHFSYMQSKPVETYNPVPEKPITSPMVREVYGPNAENVRIAWRTPAAYTKEAMILNFITSVLSNGKAGLLDININQKQKMQGAYNHLLQYKDYGVFMLGGSPKADQTLDDVKNILLEEMEKLKQGEFDEDLLTAIIANYKLGEQEALKSNNSRLGALLNIFIKSNNSEWDKDVAWLDDLSKLTKDDIVSVANKYFTVNNLTIYKRQGEDKNMVKVDKPAITPVETNAGKESAFVSKIKNTEVRAIQPQWVDFDKDLTKDRFQNTELLYIQNKESDLFTMQYRFDMGSYNNKYLPIALAYLNYLSTGTYTSEALNKKLYSLASGYTVNASGEVTNVTFTGLQENFNEITKLFEHVIYNCKPNEEALEQLKGRILKGRADSKLNKQNILRGLVNYGVYGAKNPFNDVIPNEEIEALTSNQLISILHNLLNYKHSVVYFGPKPLKELKKELASIHKMPKKFTAYPEKVRYTYEVQDKNRVLFADYDMVQSEIQWVRNIEDYTPGQEAVITVFNEYFGGGMGSIVFQTIRESKALAYATYANYSIPSKKEQKFNMFAYVGSQADKMLEAVDGMNELLNMLPLNEKAFENSKESIKKSIQTQRITESNPIYLYLGAKDKGIDYDIRKEVYEAMDRIAFEDINTFHNSKISQKPFTYCIIGSEEVISDDDLKKIGELKKFSLEDIFGY
ncbi:insulinase family protein [Galbibacter sp. EGI 63066]|uniref:M16 family metallopeptidase n=1 Tax=Galbibacter sp. EGI 63066 TaxID=2993559 RepID=UPI0022499B4A|nr:M16 family metallopeptidase [Galbibacter sp. EGI 63066]MCX2681977.1 insulinase family protein [Galbibacter sp. EGI 63066]